MIYFREYTSLFQNNNGIKFNALILFKKLQTSTMFIYVLVKLYVYHYSLNSIIALVV